MRTKALLIAAAAFAAGVISSQAQVYSQNIVGYVNQPLKVGFTTFANPLDQANGNSLTNILQPGTFDGYGVSVWTGTGFTQYTIDSGFPTGVANASDSVGVPAPTLNPGTAFFIDNTVGSNTVTEVSTVHVDVAATGTNVVGTTTNLIGTSPIISFVSSKLPIGGLMKTTLGLDADASADGDVISIPIINAGGSVTGFNQYTLDSGFPTGFANASDSAGVPEPSLPVAGGFFFDNTVGAAYKWTQSF